MKVIDKYIDNGYSGTNFDRPALYKKINSLGYTKVQRRSSNKNDIFSGYLRCADCNGVMSLIKGKENEYYCRNNISRKICSKHTIRKDYIINEIITLINSKKLLKDKIENLNRESIMELIDIIYIYENSKIKICLKDVDK